MKIYSENARIYISRFKAPSSSSKAKANVLGLEQILKRRQWFGKLTFNKRNKSITKLAQVF